MDDSDDSSEKSKEDLAYIKKYIQHKQINREEVQKYTSQYQVYLSKDDELIPFQEAKNYFKNIPQIKIRIFEDKGHFTEKRG